VVCPPPDTSPVEPEPASLVPPVADDRDDRFRRAADHLAALGQQGGHGPAWDAAYALIGTFGMTPKEALPILTAWNTTCRSPLSTYDLAWKLDYVVRAARHHGLPPGTPSGMAGMG
jgi:hypothetical protein